MEKYKKSKLGLFLKIIGSIVGGLAIIGAIFLIVKAVGFTNEFEQILGKFMIVYAISILLASMITAGTLWGIAIILDNQIRIEAKLDVSMERKIEIKEKNTQNH